VLLSLCMLTGCGANDPAAELGPKSPNASELWGDAGERWSPSGRLPDFSHAGYHQGEVEPPEVPVTANVRDFGALGDGVTDDSLAFLAAIESVERGAIFIPEGRYRLTEVLRLTRSGVVLRGAGRDRTVLFFPRPLYEVAGVGPQLSPYGPYGWSWGGGLIWAEGAPDEEIVLTRITSAAAQGDQAVEVESTAGIEPGQIVRLVQYESDGSLSLHLHDGFPLDGPCLVDKPGFKIVDWALEVEEVERRRLRFGRPLRLDVSPGWNAEIRAYRPSLEEVGVERLTIEFPETEYNGHHKEPGYNGILFQGVYNGWVRDVRIVNFDSGIHFWYSRYTTGDGVLLSGRGGHYGLNLGGCQDCLMTRFTLENSSVHDLSTSNLGNGSVFSRGRGPDINFDHHRGAAYQNLYSDIDIGAAWKSRRVWECSGTRTGHDTAARETFWNLAPKLIDRRLPHWPAVNIIGRIRRSDEGPAETNGGWIESVPDLEPRELHRAQLARRLGRQLADPLPLPEPPSGRADPFSRGQDGAS
jgi:hypothetical protein